MVWSSCTAVPVVTAVTTATGVCRLTGNMLDGMGLSGAEGVYRRVSEVTMTVLRNNRWVELGYDHMCCSSWIAV